VIYSYKFRHATGLVSDGMFKNVFELTTLDFSYLLFFVVLTVMLPILSLMIVFPLISLTFWIAFKDIYLRDSKVTEKEIELVCVGSAVRS
jgi:hypothetical protein